MFPSSVSTKEADDIVANHLIPVNKKSPGFRSMSSSAGALMSPSGPAPYERIVEASFDSMADVVAAAESAVAKKEAAARMMALDVRILMYEVRHL